MIQDRYRRKALLIQDIRDYLLVLRTELLTMLHEYDPQIENYEAVITWIVREEIETIYAVNCVGHDYRAEPYRTIYSLLCNKLNGRSAIYFSSVVSIPRIYNFDCMVKVEIIGTDLYVWYES